MSTERILALAVFLCAVLLLLRQGPAALHGWRIYAGTGRRRQQDATGRAPLPPPSVADRMAMLADLGYHRLGETSLDLPVGRRFAWILAADDAESYAILVDNPRVTLSGVYSAWSDGTWLCAIHPRGQAVDRVGLQVRIVPTTLAEMVSIHRAGLERLKQVHGAPRPIATMADMLALDADYRTRFGGTRLRPTVTRIIAPAVLLAAIAALSLVLIVVSPR